MVFEAIATRMSVSGEAPAVYKEYMWITEKFIRNEFSRSPVGVKHMEVLYKIIQRHNWTKKLFLEVHPRLKSVYSPIFKYIY
jgi:hypothetical protein